MRHCPSNRVLRARTWASAVLFVLVLAIWGCTGDPDEITGVVPAPKGSGSGTGTDVIGGVSNGGGSQNGTSGTPTPAPTPTPTKTPSPTPTATTEATPPAPFAVAVYDLVLGANSVTVAPPLGMTALYPYTTTVSAKVLLSNGDRQATVQWDTSNHAIATVDSQGFVTAGSVPGAVRIIATSLDGQASDSLTLNVVSTGGATIEVD